MNIGLRLGWLLFGLAGFFAPDWATTRFSELVVDNWKTAE